MFGSDVLEIAIGLLFIYSLLSVIGSAIAELIEAKLKLRSKDLEQGIRELLADTNGTGLVKQLYEHPLVFSLFQGKYNAPGGPLTGSNLPSYIPARNFAIALIDTIAPSTDRSDTIGSNVSPGALELRSVLNSEKDSHAHQALAALLRDAQTDMNAFRQSVEKWYDSAMDRVSGWYKRRTQLILLGIGLGLAVAMNADTIAMTRSLSQDRAVRASLVAAAEKYAANHSQDAADPKKRIEENIAAIRQHGLAIGWKNDDQRLVPVGWEAWIPKLLGWALTAIAISLGAPFWFDLLNRVMIIRSTVKPHEKSPEEPSADR